MRSVLFPIILIAILLLLEYYAYKGLKGVWDRYKRWHKNLLKSVFLVLTGIACISLPILFIWGGSIPNWATNFFFGFIMLNFLAKLILALFLVVDDLRRLTLWVNKRYHRTSSTSSQEEGISRSAFLLKTGVVAAAVPTISLPIGMFVGPYKYTLHHPTLSLPNLPAVFDGLKVVQISDIHAGSFYDKSAVNKGIDLLLAQQPDVIFFTGDLVNNIASEMDDYMDVFSRLKAPMGVYSVLGNHDYGDYHRWNSEHEKAANLERLKEVHKELGWRLLLDEHEYLEKDGARIGLIGVQNWGKGFHQIGNLPQAARNCKAPVKLLLSHDPTHWDEEVTKAFKDIDVTFSGHTHGAQIGVETGGFKWSPVSLRYDKWAGLYQKENQYLYINRGYGFLGYPGRIGIWPEITVMTLNKGYA